MFRDRRYNAPEYIGELWDAGTKKSDVYSLSMFIVEVSPSLEVIFVRAE